MLVMIKATLYERAVCVCEYGVWTFRNVGEDLSLEMTAGGLGGRRRL